MNTEKWKYNETRNQYEDTENQEFDNDLNFISPIYFRIDPDTGKKFFKYNTPPMYNVNLYQNDVTPEHNAFRKNIYNNSAKPIENNFDSNEVYQTSMYYWLNVNVPLSRYYWVIKKDYYLEDAVFYLLKKMGYSAQLTETSYDNGIDLWVQDDDNNPLCIQCKGTARIGPAIIREAIGVRTMQSKPYRPKLDVVVVCPNGFSTQAEHTAKKNKVLLVDATDLCAAYRGESNPFCFNNKRRIVPKPFELFIDEFGNLKKRTNVYI